MGAPRAAAAAAAEIVTVEASAMTATLSEVLVADVTSKVRSGVVKSDVAGFGMVDMMRP